MISNSLLKVVSAILAVVTFAALIWEIGQQNQATVEPLSTDSRIVEGSFVPEEMSTTGETIEATSLTNGSAEVAHTNANSLTATGRLTVGIIGATPSQDEIVNLQEIPWLDSQVNRAFRQAEQTACTLLTPGVPIDPTFGVSTLGSRRSLGRVPAFTVGLEIDDSAKKSLPVASRGAIQAYLRDHRLAIEPTIYESEEGKLYIGTDCRAAFYQPSSPSRTVESEPMIDEAIARFRSLGVLGGDLASDGRTLLMAFRYVKSGSRITSIASGLDTTTELLFLHLDPQATSQYLKFSAFVTSEERQQLHRLAISGRVLQEPTPTIMATIRFDSFVMMGMYPAEPVVTGVRHQATGMLPVKTIRLLTSGKSSSEPMTFEDILDRFDELSHRGDLPR